MPRNPIFKCKFFFRTNKLRLLFYNKDQLITIIRIQLREAKVEYEIKTGRVFMPSTSPNTHYKTKSSYWNNSFFFESKIMYPEKDYSTITNNNG